MHSAINTRAPRIAVRINVRRLKMLATSGAIARNKTGYPAFLKTTERFFMEVTPLASRNSP